jgi:hypothetical protein
MRAEDFLNLPEKEAVKECNSPTCPNFENFFGKVFENGTYDPNKRVFNIF